MPARPQLLVLCVTTLVVLGGTVSVSAAPATEAPAIPDSSGVHASTDPTETKQSKDHTEVTSRNIDYGSSNRVDFLEVRSTGNGEYAYRMTVRGHIQKTRANNRLKAEHNDRVRDNGDGTMTVVGTTGNGQSDAFVFSGEVVAFEKIRGNSGGTLVLNGLQMTRDDLLHADILEVVSTEEDVAVRYTFTVRGTVERTRTSDAISAGNNDGIHDNGDGTVTVRGVTGNQHGDAYRIEGTITSFSRTGGESDLFVRLDGLEISTESLGGTNSGTDTAATPIDSCTVIDDPGAYRLTTDLRQSDAETCIEITASDVVLDGGDHVIQGTDREDTTGIAVIGPENALVEDVTIRNVRVRDWGTGIQAGSVLDDVTVARLQIRDVVSLSNHRGGIGLDQARDSVLRDVTVRNNDIHGIDIWELKQDNVVRDSRIEDNAGVGIYAFEGGTHLDIRNNRITRNNGGGIVTSNFDQNITISGNHIADNGRHGIDLFESTNATIAGNVIQGNEEAGIFGMDFGPTTAIRANHITENGADGIALSYTSRAQLRANSISRNAGYGISLEEVSESSVIGNTVCENGGDTQIVVVHSPDTRIANNDVTCD